MKKILLILGGLFVCVLVYLVIYVASSIQNINTARKNAGAYYHDILTHDYAGAHRLMAPDAQRAISADDLRGIEERVEAVKGKPSGSASYLSLNIQYRNGKKTVAFGYRVPFQQGDVRGEVVMEDAQGQWRVGGWHYKRPTNVPAPGSPPVSRGGP